MSDLPMNIEELLHHFGYTPGWLVHGFVTEEFLRLQLAEWSMGEDQNAEHYRCGAFRCW